MKYIIASLGVMAAALTLTSANAANIKKLEDIKNNKAYILKRQATTGNPSGNLNYLEGSNFIQATNTVGATDPNAQWSIHYSEAEKSYYLYNLGSGKFAAGDSRSRGIFSETAVKVTPIWLESAAYWVFDCGGNILGLEKDDAGAVIFTDEVTKDNSKEMGFCFIVSDSPNRELTDAEINAIEAKVKEGRQAAIDKYLTFIEKAEKMDEKKNEKYAGGYDLTEFKAVMSNYQKYSLNYLEECYNRCVESRLPKYGYWRLRNDGRPTTYTKSLLTVQTNGSLRSEELASPTWGTAGGDRMEDLNIFSCVPNNGDFWNVRLLHNPSQRFLELPTANNSKLWASEGVSGTVFTLTPYQDYKWQFYLAHSEAETMVTISGSNEAVSWNQTEQYMRFYFEKVNDITVTTDANGYLSTVLPANITLPEGVQAWVCTSVRDGKAYFEEAAEGIGAYTPFVLKAGANANVTLPLTGIPVWYASGMTGKCIKTEAPARQQIVSTASGFEFQPVEAGTVSPCTAWAATDALTPLEVVMGADPESGIAEIEAAEGLELFDMHGRLVNGTPRPGLYINAATHRVVRVK